MEGQTTSQPPPESNQDDEDPPKVDLPEQLQKIVPATELPPSLNRWNTNEEIASILIAFDQHKEWLLDKPRVRPASGSLLMYNRKKVMFRRDGYCWKKRRDGKTNREDHMKLKVKGAECIYGSYVHSAILPTFHRRCYWLLQNPNVVLVHYLNVPNPPNNPKPSQMPSLSGEMRKKEWTKEELVDQLRPMLASDRQGELNPDQDLKVEETLEAIFQRLVSSQEDRGGAKPLAVEGGHHQHPCALAAPHSCCNPRPAVKQELACLQQQQGNQLGGCVSTMAHVQVSANTLSHHHPLQQALPLPTAVSTMATVPALSGSHHGDLHLLTATPGVLHHGALPTTTVSTSQSQLTLATFSHMHLAASSSSTSSPSSLSLRSIPASVESQIPHQRPSAPVNAPSPSMIPSSVNLLTGLAGPDQYPGVAILPPGSVPVVSQSFPSMADSGLFKLREQGLSAALSMTTTTSMNRSVVSLPGHPGSSVVHLHPSGLVAKEEDGALSSVVVFTSAHNPSVPTSHFGSISQVAHAHTQPAPLPGPSKDIPLFAANPLTHCGNTAGCDEAAGCAEENGISGGGDGGGVVGVDVVAGLTDAGDNCDTLDGSFSSLPSTDLNLDLFLDLQDLEDCAADLAAATSLSPPHLPPSPSSPLGSSSSLLPLATSSPLMAGRDMNIGTSSSSIVPASHHNHHHQHHHHQHTLDVMSGSYLNNSTSPNAQLSQSLSGDDDNSKQAFPPGCVWEGSVTPQPLTDTSLSPPPSQTPHHDVIAHHLGMLNSCGVKVVDVGSFLLQQPQGCTKNSSSSAPTANSANICDFSPEWAYAQSNTKVLVAGPWCNVTAVYTCVFDDKHVAATLIQPGVLRCFTPDHKAGRVSLKVAQDGQIISNSPMFEFRDGSQPSSNPQPEPPVSTQTDWFDTSGAHLKQLLLERLGKLERRFISGEKSSSLCSTQNLSVESPEASLLAHVELLMKQQWSTDHLYPKAGLNGLTLLHLASAQGYAKLISALIRWRSCNSSPALEYEVDAHSVDNQACTPLMWACAKGQIDAALTLYHWNGGALGVCNKDGQLPLALARQRGHHNLAAQVEQLEQAHFKTPAPAPAKIRCQNLEAPSSSPAGSTDSNPLPQPMSPDTVKVEQPEGDGGSQGDDQDAQPMQTCQLPSSASPLPPLPPPPLGPGKLIRRFSEQVISPSASSSHHPLSKRYSVDLLTSDTKGAANAAPPAAYHMRDSSSEPRLPLKPEAEFEGSLHEGQTQRVPSLTFVLEPDSLLGVRRKVAGSDRSFLSPLDPGQLPMDTDEGSSRSDSPFIDVERVSSDEEAEKQDDSKHQMVTLANQIIAAMPERIKLSPSKGDDEDDGCSVRTRSESHSSSAPSQGSPRPSSSSFGDDSGISTPMTDNLAFEEYRYTDFGTPASSLSPDSTCLPSPYSPYSFALDSPPPTTADFTEYFNAPATYMEKDFSQLTLSDQEQRKLYEAAKVIQNAYRHYRDKQQQQQHQKEIEAAVLIQSYYRRYKQYAYYKKMTHAAVLIQNQFRSYSAQKRKKNPGGSTQGSRRELERLKKGRNQSVIIQQRFRSHYQRKSLDGKEGTSAMGVGAGDAPDSSPPSEEVQQAASHDRSPTADEPGTADVST